MPVLLVIFTAAAAAVWVAGVYLSNATDVLSSRFGLGEALGGLLLLALVTNLPEIAITASAALNQNLGIAIGNILGGVAIQTVVLAVLDVFGLGKSAPLTYRAASLVLVLEGALVVAILATVVIGSQLPTSLIFDRVAPAGLLIVVLWLAGLWLIGKARTSLPWHDQGTPTPPDGRQQGQGYAKKKKDQASQQQNVSTARTIRVFLVGAVVTLVAGIVLEGTGNGIASFLGMDGVLFGATILAAATALPELSTGLASVKLGDYQLAVSDIFGGNAFLPVLFLLASLLSGQAVLPGAQASDIYLTGLGILLTTVYLYGLIFRSRRQIARMGLDSLVVIILYALGVLGLVAISRG